MDSKDILKSLQEAVDFMDRHPIAIAISMTPSFKSQLTAGNHLNSMQFGGMGIMDSYSSLRAYIWKDLPEPYRIYYNQTILARDMALYNS